MQGVDIAVVILLILPAAQGQGGIEQVFAIPTGGGKEEDAQPWLLCRRELPGDAYVGRERLRTPEHEVGLLPIGRVAQVFHAQTARGETDARLALQPEAGHVGVGRQWVVVNRFTEGERFHAWPVLLSAYGCWGAWYAARGDVSKMGE